MWGVAVITCRLNRSGACAFLTTPSTSTMHPSPTSNHFRAPQRITKAHFRRCTACVGMLPDISIGDYVAQVMNFEENNLRLLQDIQLYTAEGHARSGAIYKVYFSSRSSAIEKHAFVAANSLQQISDSGLRNSTASPTGSFPSKDHLRGDLTLSLISIDTTWRFDTFNNRVFSPSLIWPTIRKFFEHTSYVEADLILKDQHHKPHTGSLLSKTCPHHMLF